MKDVDIDDDAFKGIEAIIHSMTPNERSTPANPSIINASRKKAHCEGFRYFSSRSESIDETI